MVRTERRSSASKARPHTRSRAAAKKAAPSSPSPAERTGVVNLDVHGVVEVGQDVEGSGLGDAQLGESPAGGRHGDECFGQGGVVAEAGEDIRTGLANTFGGDRRPCRGGRAFDQL